MFRGQNSIPVFRGARSSFRLSRAGLETLAIVAYKQPITRAEIEAIRGVGAGSVVANLMERSLVEIVGKAKVLGAPFLYGTTQEFLEYLGLNSLKDLPSMEDLEALLAREAGEQAVEGEEIAEAERALRDAMPPAEGGPDRDGTTPHASSASVGPHVDEPVNRPLYGGSGGLETVPAELDDEDVNVLGERDDERNA